MSFLKCLRQIFRLSAASLCHIRTAATAAANDLRRIFNDFPGMNSSGDSLRTGLDHQIHLTIMDSCQHNHAAIQFGAGHIS